MHVNIRSIINGSFLRYETWSKSIETEDLDFLKFKWRSEHWWLINFNGMLTCLRIFYTYRLGNHVHCVFILTFFVLFLFCFCTWFYQIQIIFKQISLRHRNNDNEKVPLTPDLQRQFRSYSEHLFWGTVSSKSRQQIYEYSWATFTIKWCLDV